MVDADIVPGGAADVALSLDTFAVSGKISASVPAGAVVAGAKVTLREVDGDEAEDEPDAAVGESGADGVFTLEPKVDAGKFMLTATKDGYAAASVEITVTAEVQPGGDADVVLVLGPQPVSGVVTIEGSAEDDAYVSGATLVLSGDEVVLSVPEGAEEGTEPQPPTAISNGVGYFDFGDLAPGVYVMEATAPGYTPNSKTFTVEGPIDDDGNALASLTLKEQSFKLSGLVKSAQVGAPESPLAGAKVTVRKGSKVGGRWQVELRLTHGWLNKRRGWFQKNYIWSKGSELKKECFFKCVPF